MDHFQQFSSRLDAAGENIARVVVALARELRAANACDNCSNDFVETNKFVERAGNLPRAPKDVSFLVQTVLGSGARTDSSKAGFCNECEGAWNRNVEN